MCGVGAYKDSYKYITKSFSHTSSNLKLRITSNLNEKGDNESFGFNDLIITACN